MSTTAITGITTTTAISGAWSIATNPTIAGSHTSDGTGTGSFVSSLVGLSAGTKYYVRAYATNSVGTAFGNEVSFATLTHPVPNEVIILSMAFISATLTVPVNSTVRWRNKDGITHTVTSDTGAWDIGNIAGGNSFSFQFTAVGTYHYHCAIHPMMLGTIIVQ